MAEKIPAGWKREGKWLARKMKFKTFLDAVGFVNIVSTIAEEAMHHPDIEIKNYNEVVLKTTTHKAGKLTEKDFQLAGDINKMLSLKEYSKTMFF